MPGNGWGNPIRPCGLIASAFRPSDDATTFLFLISSNHFAAVALRQLAELAGGPAQDALLARNARSLAEEVSQALQAHGTALHPVHGRIWAFEVDGFGNALFMDDANVPSLLALPYLGACAASDPLYLTTRRFLLSPENPWYCKGRAAEGIGGPHAGLDTIWPMSMVTRAFTTDSELEIRACLRMLVATRGGEGFIHESIHKDDPAMFTRPWFAWANTYFGELVLHLYRTRPTLLRL
jgi:meiotically up-regulated gene 157 (Mug157) protein